MRCRWALRHRDLESAKSLALTMIVGCESRPTRLAVVGTRRSRLRWLAVDAVEQAPDRPCVRISRGSPLSRRLSARSRRSVCRTVDFCGRCARFEQSLIDSRRRVWMAKQVCAERDLDASSESPLLRDQRSTRSGVSIDVVQTSTLAPRSGQVDHFDDVSEMVAVGVADQLAGGLRRVAAVTSVKSAIGVSADVLKIARIARIRHPPRCRCSVAFERVGERLLTARLRHSS